MSAKASRSRRVRLGLSGCGGMSRSHTRALRDVKQADIVGLMDVVPESTEKLAAELVEQGNPSPELFTDYEKMIDSLDLDGVILVTPHSIHFPQAMYALRRGVHVLVEKPMTTDRTQARKLVAQATRSKRVVSIAFQSTYTPEFQFIKGLREKGELGEVYSFVGCLTQNWLRAVRGRWRVEPELSGGGQLYDSGSHMLNAMLYLTDLQPVEVFAFSDYKGMKVDITSALVVKFNNGALARADLLQGWGTGPVPSRQRPGFQDTRGQLRRRHPGQGRAQVPSHLWRPPGSTDGRGLRIDQDGQAGQGPVNPLMLPEEQCPKTG